MRSASVGQTSSSRHVQRITQVHCRAFQTQPPSRPVFRFRHSSRQQHTVQHVCHAADDSAVSVQQPDTPAPESNSDNFIPVIAPEELPKGIRKEVTVDEVNVLLFWYRNQIYAIEARSPAEGAYSEGFINAKLTQDYAITCPSTGTLFSLKTGEILDWYPNNAVLRMITPRDTCRNLDIYPVKLTQEAISVDVSRAASTKFSSAPSTRGGADSSIDANNVFADQVRTYYEGQDPETGEVDMAILNQTNPYVISVSVFGIATAGVGGSAYALYKESYIGLALLWVGIIAVAAYSVKNYTSLGKSN